MKKVDFSINVNSPLDSEYVQKLSFKAGYHWLDMYQEPKYATAKQLFFHPDKTMARGSEDAYSDTKINYSFPKDAVKIHEIFNTPEYKKGDYVVLVDKRPWRWNQQGRMDKFLGSIQCLERDVKEEITFNTGDTKGWTFYALDIARHATEEEIKAYKEGGDIYIGEHKVEFLASRGVKIGCVGLTKHIMKAIETILYYTVYNGGSFVISKKGIQFMEGNFSLSNDGIRYSPEHGKGHTVPKGQFDKIISLIRAGIK